MEPVPCSPQIMPSMGQSIGRMGTARYAALMSTLQTKQPRPSRRTMSAACSKRDNLHGQSAVLLLIERLWGCDK